MAQRLKSRLRRETQSLCAWRGKEQMGQPIQSRPVRQGLVYQSLQRIPVKRPKVDGTAWIAQRKGAWMLVRALELSWLRISRDSGLYSSMISGNLMQQSLIIQQMAQKNSNALQKMQQIASRLISNTPQLAKMLDADSALRPKKPSSPTAKKGKPNQPAGSAPFSKTDLTANDYHQKCRDLSSQVQYWKEKCVSLEEQISIIKQRFVEREIQYRGIIQELQEQIKSKSCLDSSDRNRMQLISELHKQIQENINSIQNKTSKILIEQESDIRRFFNKKINEIKEKFKEDKINKNQKDHQYQQKQKQMASELEWIKNIAHKIDQENKTLMKKYSSLKSEFEIQERDKEMLLKELLMKKKQNAALRAQVQQYEKLLNQVSKEMEEDPGRQQLELSRSSKMQQSSKLKTQKTQSGIDTKRADSAIIHLQNVIAKERNKVRELKNLYMKEMGNKSQLQKIIRSLVEDVRQSIVEVQKDKYSRKKNAEMSGEARQQLLTSLLANEKILTLIYDKTFYSGGNKALQDIELPPELKKIIEDKESQGFD